MCFSSFHIPYILVLDDESSDMDVDVEIDRETDRETDRQTKLATYIFESDERKPQPPSILPCRKTKKETVITNFTVDESPDNLTNPNP